MENNPSWKGGSYTNENGYRRIRVGRQYVYEHRYVMEKALGQKLTKSEDVHHVNHNKLDNRIENLIVLSKHDHGCRHDHFRGVNNPLAKLNEKKVEEIRALYEMGATTKTLSERYNTEISNVRLIVRKKTWKHV